MDKTINIEFLFLEGERCDRCRGTGENLDEAVRLLEAPLAAAGRRVAVSRIRVGSVEEAARRSVRTSPTVRVEGRDIQPNFQETPCGSCSDMAPDAGGVACRQWEWQGAVSTAAPVGLLVEAILGAVFGGTAPAQEDRRDEVPENLRRFFENVGEPAACCSPGCCDGGR